MAKYYFSKTINSPIDKAELLIREELQKEGFGVLTEIDVQQTFKKKLDADVSAYKILGACNPHFAYQALLVEDKIGTMLPCNVILREVGDGKTEIAAVDPIASMQSVENEQLAGIAGDVRDKLRKCIDAL